MSKRARGTNLPVVRCKAHNRKGEQCRWPAIEGGNVCRFHGGASPQVMRKARERLLEHVNPALSVLIRQMQGKAGEKGKKIDDERLIQAAAKEILDRAGLGKVDKLEHSGPDGGPIPVKQIPLDAYSLEDLEMMQQIIDRAAQKQKDGVEESLDAS